MKTIQIISQDVFDKVRSRFQNLEMGDETGAVTLDPAEARFFDFDFIYESKTLGRVSISLADLGSLKVYYSQGITEDQDDTSKQIWYDFLREMRMFAMRRLLRFDTRDIAKTNLDKEDFQHLAASQTPKEEDAMTQTMNESRWTRRTPKTSRVVKGGTQVIVRYKESMENVHPSQRSNKKYIEGIFVENNLGERFKCPFNDLDTALALGMHVDHGGVPHDDIGRKIIIIAEEIQQLQAFQKKVQKATLHDDALQIQEKAIGRLSELRHHLRSLSKRRNYRLWVETLNDDSADDGLVLDQVTLEDYKAKFTQTSFIEGLEEYFPLLHKIMKEANTIDLEEYVEEEKAKKPSNDDELPFKPGPPKDKKPAGDSAEHGGLARARHLAKQAIPKIENFEEWADELVERDTEETTIPPVRGTATVHGIMPAENTEMTMPPGVMAEEKKAKMLKDITEKVKIGYNADNFEVGPFRDKEKILTDIEQEHGKLGRSIAVKIMLALKKLWKKRRAEWQQDRAQAEMAEMRRLSGLNK